MKDTAKIASQHAVEGKKCADCHNDDDGLKTAHTNVVANSKPSASIKVMIDDNVCLACHGSYAALAAKSADVKILTDKSGTTVNPHTAPSLNSSHQKDMKCTSCHSIHGKSDPMGYCVGCHHQQVFECGTCHAV